MDKKTKIIWKPIDELIPYEHNAKEHNITQTNLIEYLVDKKFSEMFARGEESK